MTSEECIAKALLEPGFKIKRGHWPREGFVFLEDSKWRGSDNDRYLVSVSPCDYWEPYIEPVKMVTWYKPVLVWFKPNPSPHIFFATFFHKDRSSFDTEDYKILTWEEIQAPETWEQIK